MSLRGQITDVKREKTECDAWGGHSERPGERLRCRGYNDVVVSISEMLEGDGGKPVAAKAGVGNSMGKGGGVGVGWFSGIFVKRTKS